MATTEEPSQSADNARISSMEQSIADLWAIAEELKAHTKQAVVLYLREPSRHWPRKIGEFKRDDDRDQWIFQGRAIPLEEWNQTEVEIWTTIEREYDYLKTGIKIEELPQEAADPPKQHPNLIQYQKPKDDVVEEELPVIPKPDEQPRTEERPASETLY